jgi:hypothetical protein
MRVFGPTLALVGIVLPALGASAAVAPRGAAPAVARVEHAAASSPGIRWQKSLAAAQADAARTGKPLFLLHLFGKLDEEFC